MHPFIFGTRTNVMKIRLSYLTAVALLILAQAPVIPRAEAFQARIPIRVVVVTTFENGQDTGDAPGEFQNWVERYPLTTTLPFPQGYHPLRYNDANHVLGIVTGVGKSHAAASIMALGMDPRFDLTRAYSILPASRESIRHEGRSVRPPGQAMPSTATLDMRSTPERSPSDWPTGIVPYDRATPYQQPVPAVHSDWADQLFR